MRSRLRRFRLGWVLIVLMSPPSRAEDNPVPAEADTPVTPTQAPLRVSPIASTAPRDAPDAATRAGGAHTGGTRISTDARTGSVRAAGDALTPGGAVAAHGDGDAPCADRSDALDDKGGVVPGHDHPVSSGQGNVEGDEAAIACLLTVWGPCGSGNDDSRPRLRVKARRVSNPEPGTHLF